MLLNVYCSKVFLCLQAMQLERRCGVILPQRPDSPPQGEDGMMDEKSESSSSDSSSSDSSNSTSSNSASDSASDYDGGRAIPSGIVDEILEFTGAFDYGMHNYIYTCTV